MDGVVEYLLIMKGGKPKPTVLKLLQGNPGKRAINKKEPQSGPGRIRAPSELSPEGKKHFRKMAATLRRSQLYTELDTHALALLAEAYATWCLAQRHIQEDGMLTTNAEGTTIQSPWARIASTTARQIHSLLAEFGMTPSSRSRVSITEGKVTDDFETFLDS